MSDTKITGLSSASALGGTEILAASQGGNSRGVTVAQIQTFVNTSPVFTAGDATHAAATLTSGTVLTSPVAGAMEYDGTCFYATPATSNRGAVPTYHYIRQHADSAVKANDGSQHAAFDSVTNGTLTLPIGTYTHEALISFKAMSATSGNMKWSLLGAGGATLANVLQVIYGIDAAVNTTTAGGGVHLITEAATVNIVAASTAVVCSVLIKGSFELTVAGTIIPSIAQSTAVATAVCVAGSYFACTRIGTTTAVSVGNWS